ncbi:MAG: dethiobiotin synthase [Legionellales bacterium]
MKRYFITGTDTDCGKTYVTTKLLQAVPNSSAIKPVASGCIELNHALVSSDAQQIQQHCNLSLDQINPWRFKAPASPHIAAREAGTNLSISELANYCLSFQPSGIETLFIEGAGGLIVPLNEEETWIDFLILTQIPVIIVVGMKLGCINHALLTATALKANAIQCAGWIANCIDPNMAYLVENTKTLVTKLQCPLLATINYDGGIFDLSLS